MVAKRALLVFPGTSYRPDAFVRAADELGVELVLQRTDFGATEVDTTGVHGIVAVDEPSALVAAASGLRYHSLAGVRAVSDKGVMRRMLAEAGVPSPRVQARIPRGAPVPAVRFPCVVKPPRLSGSQGVIRADDATELARAVARIRHILHRHARAFAADEGFFELLVEDYVDGVEVAVEGLMREGELMPIAVFDKPDPLSGPYFEETIYVTPSAQPRLEAIYRVTLDAARSLGLDHGPVHAELRVGENGPELIEIAARSIGGLCSRALIHVVGSLERMLLQHAVGDPLSPPRGDGVASGVMMIPVPRSGILRAAHGVEAARAVAGIDGVTISMRGGETMRRAPDGDSYLGFIFAHGATAGMVTTALREAHASLRFDVTPLLPTL